MDTGALSSSLHVYGVERISSTHVRFVPLTENGRAFGSPLVRKISRITRVRAGAAPANSRFFIKTRIVIGSWTRTIELNLTDRRDYRFRMILGRTAIRHAFLVDVSRSNLLRNKAKKGARS